MINLSLSDGSAPLWRRMLRAARVTAANAVEVPDVSVAVLDAAGLDDFAAAVTDDVSASLDRFGFMPSGQGLLAYAELGGEAVEVARLAGVEGINMLLGLCDGDLTGLQEFVGETITFDQLVAVSTATGEEWLRKYIGKEEPQDEQ